MLTTASLAVSKQILQSKFESGPPPVVPFEDEVDGPSLLIPEDDDGSIFSIVV